MKIKFLLLAYISFICSCDTKKAIILPIPPSPYPPKPQLILKYTNKDLKNSIFVLNIYKEIDDWQLKESDYSFKDEENLNYNIFVTSVEVIVAPSQEITLPRLLYSNYHFNKEMIPYLKIDKKNIAVLNHNNKLNSIFYTLYSSSKKTKLSKRQLKEYLSIDVPKDIKEEIINCSTYVVISEFNLKVSTDPIDNIPSNLKNCWQKSPNIKYRRILMMLPLLFKSANIPSRVVYGYLDINKDGYLKNNETIYSVQIYIGDSWKDIFYVPKFEPKFDDDSPFPPDSSPFPPPPNGGDKHIPDIEEQKKGKNKNKSFLEYKNIVIFSGNDIKRYYVDNIFNSYNPIDHNWTKIPEKNNNYFEKITLDKISTDLVINTTFYCNSNEILLPKPFYSFIKDIKIRDISGNTVFAKKEIKCDYNNICKVLLPDIKLEGVYNFEYKVKVISNLSLLKTTQDFVPNSYTSIKLDLKSLPQEVSDFIKELSNEKNKKNIADKLSVFVSSYVGYCSLPEIRKAVIEDFTNGNTKYKNFIEHVLNLPEEKRYADCDVHNTIFLALASYYNIPGRLLTGFIDADFDGKISFSDGHGWSQLFLDGKWIEYDATSPRLCPQQLKNDAKNWRKNKALLDALSILSLIDVNNDSQDYINKNLNEAKNLLDNSLADASKILKETNLSDKKNLHNKINEVINMIKKELSKEAKIPGIKPEELAKYLKPPKKDKIINNEKLIDTLIKEFANNMEKEHLYISDLTKYKKYDIKEIDFNSVYSNFRFLDAILALETARIIAKVDQEQYEYFQNNPAILKLFFKAFKETLKANTDSNFKIIKIIANNYYPQENDLNAEVLNYLATINYGEKISAKKIAEIFSKYLIEYSANIDEAVSGIIEILDEDDKDQNFRKEIVNSLNNVIYKLSFAKYLKNEKYLKIKKEILNDAINNWINNDLFSEKFLNLLASTYDKETIQNSYKKIKDKLNQNKIYFHKFLTEANFNDDNITLGNENLWENFLYALERFKNNNKLSYNLINEYFGFVEKLTDKEIKSNPHILCVLDKTFPNTPDKDYILGYLKILHKYLELKLKPISDDKNYKFTKKITYIDYSKFPYSSKTIEFKFKNFLELYNLELIYNYLQSNDKDKNILEIINKIFLSILNYYNNNFDEYYKTLFIYLASDDIEKQIFTTNQKMYSEFVDKIFNEYYNEKNSTKKGKILSLISMFYLTNKQIRDKISKELVEDNSIPKIYKDIVFLNLCKPNYYIDQNTIIPELDKYLSEKSSIFLLKILEKNKDKYLKFYSEYFSNYNKEKKKEDLKKKINIYSNDF